MDYSQIQKPDLGYRLSGVAQANGLRRKINLLVVLLVLPVLAQASAADDPHPLHGTWISQGGPNDDGSEWELALNPDGSFRMVVTAGEALYFDEAADGDLEDPDFDEYSKLDPHWATRKLLLQLSMTDRPRAVHEDVSETIRGCIRIDVIAFRTNFRCRKTDDIGHETRSQQTLVLQLETRRRLAGRLVDRRFQ